VSTTTPGVSPNNVRSQAGWCPVGTTAHTGEECPESGSWTVVGHDWISASIPAGQVMPHYLGKEVTWSLVRYGL
jgi:hypothetical protein